MDPDTGSPRRPRREASRTERPTRERPPGSFDSGLQHERTALAWERTAISIMVAGVLLGRYAATDAHFTIAFVGIVQVVVGGGLLVWSSLHYDELHGPLRAGDPVVHPNAARVVGVATVVFSGFALLLAVLLALSD